MFNMPEFFQSVESDDLVVDTTKHFDAMSVMYELIGLQESVNIKSKGNSQFVVTTDSKLASDHICRMHGSNYTVYGSTYGICVTPCDGCIDIGVVPV